VKQIVVPCERVNVEQHRARRVANVGDVLTAAGQLPNQPAVNRTECQFAFSGACPGSGDVVEDPANLGGGEIRVDDQSGLLLHGFGRAVVLQLLTEFRRPPVLPDDRVVNWFPGIAVPHDGGLTLVRDPHCRDVTSLQLGALDRFNRDANLRCPKFLGVVFNPARVREDLREFLLCHRADGAVMIEDNRAGTRRTLIEREDVSHGGRVYNAKS